MRSLTIKHNTLGNVTVIPDTIKDRIIKLEGGRQYQANIVLEHLRNYRNTLTVSPTGSGKSIIIMADVARHRKNVIIATPKLSINSGFLRLTRENFTAICNDRAQNKHRKYSLRCGKVKTPIDDKALHLQELLLQPGRSVLVCSHASLINFLRRRSRETKEVLANTIVYLDEVHHSDIENENTLGETVKKCLKLCYGVHAFTATPFRTDGAEILNGEFKHWRRTLKEHHEEAQCPDFSIHVRFFDKVKTAKQLENYTPTAKSSRNLIDAYLDEYKKNSNHPTLMIVDERKEAFKLEQALRKAYSKKRIINLGSDDGKTLISAGSSRVAEERYELLKIPNSADVVIAIKMMDEGSDWPDCSQTFSPRVSISLQLIMQRAIGRSLRKKEKWPTKKQHPFPNKSRVVFFEIGIDSEDKHKAAPALFQFAVRLKALCDGIDFVDDFKLKLPRKQRKSLDEQKTQLKHATDSAQNHAILSELLREQAAGFTNIELIDLCVELYENEGIVLGHEAAFELLITQKIFKPADQTTQLTNFIKRLSRSGMTWDLLMEDKEFQKLLLNVKTQGVSEYLKLLGVKGSMQQISKILQRHVNGSAWEKKQILLAMAKNGEQRPNSSSIDVEVARLGESLSSYVGVTSGSFDNGFRQEIDENSDWLVSQSERVANNKQILLKMAKNGKPKPTKSAKDPEIMKLANALGTYIAPSSTMFDDDFRQEIDENSNWLVSRSDKLISAKQELLKMAKNGKPKPKHTSKDPKIKRFATVLRQSISPSSSGFDDDFRQEIDENSDWLVSQSQKVEATKRNLLKMARNGEPQPRHSSKDPKIVKLANVFYSYTAPSSGTLFDDDFRQKIKKCSDWLINQNEIVAKKKQTLLKMAKSGKTKPSRDSQDLKIKKLESALGSYTAPSSSGFDSDFCREINECSDWLINKCVLTKQELLKMAKSGKPKPKHASKDPKIKKLAERLAGYTNASSQSFDTAFDKKIRTLRPDWFLSQKARVAKKKQELLKMAKSGKPKPKHASKDPKIRILANALSSYTNSTSMFDADFRKEIDECSDWLKQ